MMTNETKTRIEKHIIKASDSFFPMLFDFCHKSKNLYNHANYIVRHAFTKEKKWIRYAELDKILKSDVEYPDYRNMPMAQSAQQILRLLDQKCRFEWGISNTEESIPNQMG